MTPLDPRTAATHDRRMALRVTFVAAAGSSSVLAERFEDDRPLDRAGWSEVQRVAHALLPLAAAEPELPGAPPSTSAILMTLATTDT